MIMKYTSEEKIILNLQKVIFRLMKMKMNILLLFYLVLIYPVQEI